MASEISDNNDQMETSGGAVTLSAQELLSLLERTINSRLAKEEPKPKKARPDPLRYKGNQKQLDFNSSIRDKVSKASSFYKNQDNQKGAEVLQEAMDAIDARNKMVRLADRSGWDVVDEYLGDSIASDSDDEKKIRSAEQRAIRKRKFSSNQRPSRGGARGSWPRAEPSFYSGLRQGYPGSNQFSGRFSTSQYSNAGSEARGGFASRGGYKGKSHGTCYYCGKEGHWASDCDQRKK